MTDQEIIAWFTLMADESVEIFGEGHQASSRVILIRDRLSSALAEVERLKKTTAAIRQKFAKLSEDPEVPATCQQAYLCVVFALDYPDQILARYKEPTHAE